MTHFTRHSVGVERASTLIVVGLGAVLVLVAAIAVTGARDGERAATAVRTSGSLTYAYLLAQDALSQEDAVEDTFDENPPSQIARMDMPSRKLREQLAAAAKRFDEAMAVLAASPFPRDRKFVARITPLHVSYVDATDARLAGTAADAEATAERADDAQGDMQRLMENAGLRYAEAQQADVAELESTQQTVLDRTAVIVPVGVGLYLFLLAALAGLRRRLDRTTRDELARTRAQARTDQLTGLANRRGLLDSVHAPLAAAAAGHGPPIGVLLVDLDRFKEVNDAIGHHVGDKLLRQLGERLRRALPDAPVVARLGGDEFVVVSRAPEGVASAERSATMVLDVLAEPFPLEGILIHVRASIGVAVAPDHAADAGGLLRHADVAMYRAKASGGGVCVYRADRDEFTLERVVLASELRAAMDTGELVVHYQPQADTQTGEVVSVEALVRWEHPTRGLLTPDLFLPLAEQQGLMGMLTERVLELAARQAVAWERAGHSLRVAVNLASANLLDVGFPDHVASLLERTGARAEQLMLEITEDTISIDPVRVLDVAARLHGLGLALALDDFGTGSSSLVHVKRLPIQELKIDRSFVMEMERSHDDAIIVRSTVELGRNLGLFVVAEGVETASAWKALAAFGCDKVQGYFLSRPLPPDVFYAWLRTRLGTVSRRAS